MTTFVLKNLRRPFDKYAVAPTEHDALVKRTTKIFFKFCGLLRKPKLYYLVKWILLHGMLLWRQLGTFPLLQWHFWSMVTQSIFVAQFMTTKVWSSKIIMCKVKQQRLWRFKLGNPYHKNQILKSYRKWQPTHPPYLPPSRKLPFMY